MKLIKKLAKQHAKNKTEEFYTGYLEDAFEAGFRKCREMALEVLWRELNDRTPAAAMIHIKQLGEEEVHNG